MTHLNNISTCGVFPNYIAIDAAGKYLAISNYGSEDYLVRAAVKKDGTYFIEKYYDEASIITISLRADGSLDKICDLYKHEDTPSRAFELYQSSPHPHSINIAPLSSMVLVTDRGCDELVMYYLDMNQGSLERICTEKTPIETGPRNSVFHPTKPYFYVASELMPYVSAYTYDDENGNIQQICMLPTVPKEEVPENLDNFFDEPHPADIRLNSDGTYLYVTTRGDNSIAVYSVNQENGALTFAARTDSKGTHPWTCALTQDGKFLYVGNQVTENVEVFSIDTEKGTLREAAKGIAVKKPVCIQTLSL